MADVRRNPEDIVPDELRVLVCAPTGGDARALREVLGEYGIRVDQCDSIQQLCDQIQCGAGAVIVAAEAFNDDGAKLFSEILAEQPNWSELPILLMQPQNSHENGYLRVLEAAHGEALVYPLGRPVRRETLVSVVRLALEARRRQYQVQQQVRQLQRSTEALNESRQRYRAIIENQSEMLCHFRLDGTILFVNAAYARACGTTPEKLINKNFWNFIPKEDRPAVRDMLECLTPEQPEVEIENGFETPRGRRWTAWTNRAVSFDADGRVIEAQSSGRDVTAQKQAEEALRESEQRFRATFESAAVGIAQVSVDGRFVQVNDRLCSMTGYSRDELTTMTYMDITHPDYRAQARMLVERVQSGEVDSFALEKQNVRPDGKPWWAYLTVSAVRNAAGALQYFIKVVEDCTDRKLTQQALERGVADRTRRLRKLANELSNAEQRERKRLARLLHDDLQQLLVAAKMHLSVINTRVEDETARQSAQQATQRIDDAIESTRDLTRELRPPVLYEEGLVSALQWLGAEMSRRHGLNVHVHSDDALPALDDDSKALLFECARELLFNTVKYAEVDHADVDVQRSEYGLRMVVCDKGKGFDASAVGEDDNDNVGFGLFSIRERLEAMDGRMTIASAVGEGTRVELDVPFASIAPGGHADAADKPIIEVLSGPGQRSNGSSDEPVRVLVVDDHAIVRQGIANLLEGDARIAVVGEADNGVDAIAAVEQYRPDVVLMDVNMPGTDGIKATRIVTRRWPDVAVIGMSVREDDGTAQALLRAGASTFVPKSGDTQQMIAAVLNARRNRPLLH